MKDGEHGKGHGEKEVIQSLFDQVVHRDLEDRSLMYLRSLGAQPLAHAHERLAELVHSRLGARAIAPEEVARLAVDELGWVGSEEQRAQIAVLVELEVQHLVHLFVHQSFTSSGNPSVNIKIVARYGGNVLTTTSATFPQSRRVNPASSVLIIVTPSTRSHCLMYSARSGR